jgi:hypothetical protein
MTTTIDRETQAIDRTAPGSGEGTAFTARDYRPAEFTLSAVALPTVVARDGLVHLVTRHGTSLERLSRVLDGVTGALLVLIGVHALIPLR